MSTVNEFVSTYPALVVIVFGLLWAGLVIQGQMLWRFFMQEFKRYQKTRDEFRRRLVHIEKSLPNGDLRTIVLKLTHIEEKLDDVASEVKDHNCEAEEWKRKIERNEVRLDHLEGK